MNVGRIDIETGPLMLVVTCTAALSAVAVSSSRYLCRISSRENGFVIGSANEGICRAM